MNGASVFGWMKVIGVLIALALIGFIGWKGYALLSAFLKAWSVKNPVNDAANKITEKITGDPSLGGWYAENMPVWLGGSAEVKAANDAVRSPVVLAPKYLGDLPLASDAQIASDPSLNDKMRTVFGAWVSP